MDKWYYKTWFVIVMLVFFLPIGLILTWRTPNWSRRTKLIVGVLIIALVVFGLNSTSAPTQQSTESNTKMATTETDKNFSSKLSKAIGKQDGNTLLALYTNAKDDAQKAKIINEINIGYMKWLADDIRDKDRLSMGLKEELLKYYTPLAFVEQIYDPGLTDLLLIRKNIGQIIQNQDMIEEARNKYGKDVQVVETPDKAQWLDVYVAKRVESAFNIKIGNVNLTDKYTDQYQITSYKSILGEAVPTDNWEAIATFKKGGLVKQGVKRFYAVQASEEKFKKSGGFEVTLPVFIEVTQGDIDYSYKVLEYRANKKNLTNSTYKAINNHVPQKTEK